MMVSALVVNAPGDIAVVRRPRVALGPADVRIRVAFAGICHTDDYILTGRHPAARYPLVPGHEFSGFVVESGPDVTGIADGDAVTVASTLPCLKCAACANRQPHRCRGPRYFGTTEDGGWQEEVVVPATAVRSLTGSGLTLEAGALVEPAANGHAATRAAGSLRGQTVVVIGPGAIGLLAAQNARAAGAARVVLLGLPQDADRLELARRLGADQVLAVRPHTSPAAVRAEIGAGPVGAVIQCAGSVEASSLAIDLADDGGSVVIEGFAGSDEPIRVRPDALVTRRLTLIGVNGWTPDDFDAALALAASGEIQLGRLLTDVFGLEEFATAFERTRQREHGTVKVAFQPNKG